MAHIVPTHQTAQSGDGLLLLALTEGGIDHGGGQYLAGTIHHGHLAAVAIARVKAHGDKAFHRRLHQQRLQIQGKVMDRTVCGGIRQFGTDLPFHGGLNQPLVGILRRAADKTRHHSRGLQGGTADKRRTFIPGQSHGNLQKLLLLPPVQG